MGGWYGLEEERRRGCFPVFPNRHRITRDFDLQKRLVMGSFVVEDRWCRRRWMFPPTLLGMRVVNEDATNRQSTHVTVCENERRGRW